MRSSSLLLAGLLVVGVASISEAQARQPSSPFQTGTIFEVTPYVGVMSFGDYLTGPYGTSITNAPATMVGTQVGMHVSPNLSIIGNIATGSSDIQASAPYVGGISIAQSTVTLLDAGLQYEMPLTGMSGIQFTPIFQAGAGAMRYSITQGYVNTNATNLAGNLGAGADISVGHGVGVRFLVKDYIGRFDVQQATYLNATANMAQSFLFSAGLRLSF